MKSPTDLLGHPSAPHWRLCSSCIRSCFASSSALVARWWKRWSCSSKSSESFPNKKIEPFISRNQKIIYQSSSILSHRFLVGAYPLLQLPNSQPRHSYIPLLRLFLPGSPSLKSSELILQLLRLSFQHHFLGPQPWSLGKYSVGSKGRLGPGGSWSW